MKTDFDGRRRRYVPLDVTVAFGRFGTRLIEKWGLEGIGTWALFLAACKREANEGTFTYTTDSDGWGKLGAEATGFTLSEFWRLTGQLHKTSRRQSGRVTTITCTVWNDWNTKPGRASNEVTTSSERGHDEVSTNQKRASVEMLTTIDDKEKSRLKAQNTKEIQTESESNASPEVEVEREVESESEVKSATALAVRGSPPLAVVRDSPNAQGIVAYFVDKSRALADGASPPSRVTGQLARLVGEMLNEGQDADAVRRGVDLLVEKRLHPSALPSCVHEASLPRRKYQSRDGRMTPSEILARAEEMAQEEARFHDAV